MEEEGGAAEKEMEEAEITELYELHYSDLCSPSNLTIVDSIMETLGPNGPGLLAVTGVPNASKLRAHLLPLARKLSLLDRETRQRVFKEHNLGSDVPLKNPDRSVSSFAMSLKYAKASQKTKTKPIFEADYCQLGSEESYRCIEQMGKECNDVEFKNLGSAFQELGFRMMELGLCLARICDKAIGGNELEQSLLESCAAKGRLIHYHSHLDAFLLKQFERSKATSKRRVNNFKPLNGSESSSIAHDANSFGIHSNLWQQWHYDYGIFTVLTAPLFLLPSYSEPGKSDGSFCASCCGECPSPTGHTSLQIYHPNRKRVFMVKAPPESFIIQVGESADIISKGKLRSTLHCVQRPLKFENLSRVTFVVFLQPSWTKTFSISDYPTHANSVFSGFDGQCLVASDDEQQSGDDNDKLCREIQKIVPPLSSRLKDGMTFAEFSRETTKQYYGGSGLQSNR